MLNLEYAIGHFKSHITKAPQPCLLFLAFSTISLVAFAAYTLFFKDSKRDYEKEIKERDNKIIKLNNKIANLTKSHASAIQWLNNQHQRDRKVITASVSDAVHNAIVNREREKAQKELEKEMLSASLNVKKGYDLQSKYQYYFEKLREKEAVAIRQTRRQNHENCIADITIPIDLQSFFETSNPVASFVEAHNERNRLSSSSINSRE